MIQAQKHSTKSNQPNNYSYKIQNIAMLSQSARVVARRVAPRVPAVAVQARGYHENIVEHYENPRNVGAFDKNDVNVGTGLVGAPACGDVMKLQIQVGDDGKIIDSKFKTFGCGSAIASSSVATEWVKGKSVDEVLSIKNADIAAHLKLPPVKLHCSMLAEDAIKAAVKDWKTKREEVKKAEAA
uniref:Iron-sulfur cluster assembly protein n=1 Tax=Entomoneis paludosa TaxID=265537 RepID=A0A7S2YSX6_9STRA